MKKQKKLYKEKRNLTQNIICKAHQVSWDKLTCNIENEILSQQTLAYKFIRNLNNDERDQTNIWTIWDKDMIRHYKDLWYNPAALFISTIGNKEKDIDWIEIYELEAFETSKNWKATGPDNIIAKLFMHRSNLYNKKLLYLFNICWKECVIPPEWQLAQVISIFKKGGRNSCENYPEINLLNSANKIFSMIINNTVKKLSGQILLEEQSGFR